MKAVILAAGLGTRLRPLTLTKPKALIEVDGVPILERVIISLKNHGIEEIIVNTHHFSNKISEFISSKEFGVKVNISDEKDLLLNTGGGILKAVKTYDMGTEPFLVHNVDIISNADIKGLEDFHLSKNAAVSLLVNERDSSRKLLFDSEMELKGWINKTTGEIRPDKIKNPMSFKEFAFSGIYIMGKDGYEEMKRLMKGCDSFPVMDYFLSEERKERISGFNQKKLILLDIGKPATLSQAHDILTKIQDLH